MINRNVSVSFAGQKRCSNNQNKSISFGWSGWSHELLTVVALRELNKVNIGKKEAYYFDASKIASLTRLPDEIPALKKLSHLADIDKPKDDDAYQVLFKKYREKAISAFNANDIEKFETYAAIAAHGVQDLTTPVHVPSSSKISKEKSKKLHRKIEALASDANANKYVGGIGLNYEPSKSNFMDFLKQRMRDNKNLAIEVESKKTTQQFKRIANSGLLNSYKATYEFFVDLHKELTRSSNK